MKIYGGKITKKIVLSIYMLVFGYATIIRLKAFSLILSAISFRHTSIFIIAMPIIAVITISVLTGFEKIIRVSGYLLVFVVLLCIFIFAISFSSIELVHYTPILGKGIDKLFTNMPIIISIFTPLVFILFFKSNDLKYKNAKKILFSSMIINTLLIFILATKIYNVLYGHILDDFKFPLYQSLAITIVNEYSDGFEIIISYIFFFVTLVHLSFITYLTCDFGSRIIPKVNSKYLSLIIIAIIYSSCFFQNNIVNPIVQSGLLRVFTFIAFLVIPLVISMIYFFKKNNLKKEELK